MRHCEECLATTYLNEWKNRILCEKCLIFYDVDPELVEYGELQGFEEVDDGMWETKAEAEAKAKTEAERLEDG